MKNAIIILGLITTLSLLSFPACDSKPTAPQWTNPFDPDNPETGGDPFKLTAKYIPGSMDVYLEWNKPEGINFRSYKIWRSEQETSGYRYIAFVNSKRTSYTDYYVYEGRSYWYRIVLVREYYSEEGDIKYSVPVNIKTPPLLSINDGAKYTNSRVVNLSIEAATANQMILSNYSDFSGAEWENFVASKSWELTEGQGLKTVFLKVRYENGQESEVVQDDIILDTNRR